MLAHKVHALVKPSTYYEGSTDNDDNEIYWKQLNTNNWLTFREESTFTLWESSLICEIWWCHSTEEIDVGLVGSNAMWTFR
jgi:hypothetical protein